MSKITIDLNPDTASKMNSYFKAFGSKEMLFEEFISFHKNKLTREIARMQIELDNFEKKYKLASTEFYEKFEKGLMGDESDLLIWAGIYEMQKDSKEKLKRLK